MPRVWRCVPRGVRPAALGAAFLAVGALACRGTPSPTPTPLTATAGQVRLSFQTFSQDPARVESLVRGVRVMKSRDTAPPESAEYRTSWQYWSAIHGYYGPQAQAGRVQAAIDSTPADLRRFFDGIDDLVPPAQPPGVAQQVWDKCQHGTQHFLTWHRMYVYWFERVLRAAAGDDTLRLPYWDYTDSSQVAFPALYGQQEFQGARNPLFDERRRSQNVVLSAVRTNIDGLLREPDFFTFEGNLEQQPHGYVHCAVGGSGCPIPLMGDVPVAASDPVFWMHHANIDRIWECWLRRGGQVPEGDFRRQFFEFVDETGSLVTLSVEQLLGPSSPVDYTYENVTECGRRPEAAPATPRPRAEAAAAPPETVDAAAEVKIDKPTVKVALKVPRTGARAESFRRSFSPERAPEAGVELLLEGIQVEAAPEVLFDVYLARKDGQGQRQYVGTLTFFGAARHAAHARGPLRRHFDVSEQVHALVGAAPDVDALEVVFEATTGVADAALEEAQRRFNPRAGLRVGKVELRVRGGGQP